MIPETVIVAGGPDSGLPDLAGLAVSGAEFIGADRGALRLIRAGIRPALAIGDFDSVTPGEREEIRAASDRFVQVPAEKDETDTELALLEAAARPARRITLTGVTGGRLDHAQSALHAVFRLQSEHPDTGFRILDRTNELRFLLPGTSKIKKSGERPYVSFFAFGGQVEGMDLAGFKYDVQGGRLLPGTTMYTSNELLSEVCTISFQTGICLMIRSTDA